jgi:hypothetical protein
MAIWKPGDAEQVPAPKQLRILTSDADADWQELELGTTANNHIQNFQSSKPVDAYALHTMNLELAPFAAVVTERAKPTAMYNCHGLVFGSRRTEINDDGVLSLIISDDSYKQVDKADALPGDVLLYFHENGGIEHSALVLAMGDAEFGVPLVVSKWGGGGEYIHRANQCPYNYSTSRYFRIIR